MHTSHLVMQNMKKMCTINESTSFYRVIKLCVNEAVISSFPLRA